eukprot:GSMAST32.ASY1.ANO1.550.1 assembled CDS
MRIIIKESKDDAGLWVAKYVQKRITEYAPSANNLFVLGLPTGSSPIPCRLYEEKIFQYGGIELFLGGIGPDGHIAFNEPVANSRFFDNDISKVPKMALTVGVGTVMDSREVLIIITACVVCDEDATLELRVKTVKYFKGLEATHNMNTSGGPMKGADILNIVPTHSSNSSVDQILGKKRSLSTNNTIKSLSSGQNNNGIHDEKGENVYSKKSKQL